MYLLSRPEIRTVQGRMAIHSFHIQSYKIKSNINTINPQILYNRLPVSEYSIVLFTCTCIMLSWCFVTIIRRHQYMKKVMSHIMSSTAWHLLVHLWHHYPCVTSKILPSLFYYYFISFYSKQFPSACHFYGCNIFSSAFSVKSETFQVSLKNMEWIYTPYMYMYHYKVRLVRMESLLIG
jgi:hypothetical protein